MKFVKAVIFCLVALAAVPTFAQDVATNTNMQILLDKVKADKKLVVAANMDLTEAEAKAFWPIYNAYQKDLQGFNERIAKTVLVYAEAYNKNTLTDDMAKFLSNQVMGIDQDELKVRSILATKLNEVLPPKKAARYLQIENKIRAVIRYDLAAGIPLVP